MYFVLLVAFLNKNIISKSFFFDTVKRELFRLSAQYLMNQNETKHFYVILSTNITCSEALASRLPKFDETVLRHLAKRQFANHSWQMHDKKHIGPMMHFSNHIKSHRWPIMSIMPLSAKHIAKLS